MLVIGLGNPLRGDDAAGPEVIARLRTELGDAAPDVELVEAHSLVPELAERLAAHATTVLVDADPQATEAHLEEVATSLDATPSRQPLGHATTVRELIHLAQHLYGARGRVWLCRVPASDFTAGAPLTPACAAGVEAAVRLIAPRSGRSRACSARREVTHEQPTGGLEPDRTIEAAIERDPLRASLP